VETFIIQFTVRQKGKVTGTRQWFRSLNIEQSVHNFTFGDCLEWAYFDFRADFQNCVDVTAPRPAFVNFAGFSQSVHDFKVEAGKSSTIVQVVPFSFLRSRMTESRIFRSLNLAMITSSWSCWTWVASLVGLRLGSWWAISVSFSDIDRWSRLLIKSVTVFRQLSSFFTLRPRNRRLLRRPYCSVSFAAARVRWFLGSTL